MPNLLVGVGLLLTFVGLSLALSAAGSIVGGDKLTRDAGLQGLLNTASAKFVFSLVGLACSIGYTWWRGACLHRADRALDAFLAALEERIPLATAAALQADTNLILQQSLDLQGLFSNQLAVSIGAKLDEALDNRLGEHVGPLREAIEKLSGNLGSKTEDTMQTMLEEFLKHLHGGTDDAMHQVAKTLADLSASMAEIRAGLSEAATRMAASADQMAVQMGRQADEAMGRIATQMEGLVGQLRALAEQSRNAGTDAMLQAASQIASAGDGFTRAAQEVAASLEKAVKDMTGRMGGEAEAATRQMAAELGRAIEALRVLSENSRTAGDDAVRQLAERLGHAATAFEQSSTEVARALSGGAGDAAIRLTEAMDEMKGQFGRLADELGGALEKAGGTVVETSRTGAEALTAAASAAAEALRVGGRDGGEALRTGGADAGYSLDAAARTLTEPTNLLADRLAAMQMQAASLSSAVASMQEATTAAVVPLGRAAADLAQAGNSAQTATSDLAETGRRLVPLTEALTGTATRLELAEKQVAELSAHLATAVQRFDGMDTALAAVFVNLQRGLSGFAEQVSKFVLGTNEDMARAANTLNAAVSDLAEALEDNRPLARREPR
ncbi:MAG: hypothetical protein BGP12_12395 [Rhodospirillales bacterium 70-18]|nr:MAG: hypothetical protein BGP12_12395 [Rhodospirillales bacterium 70-18]